MRVFDDTTRTDLDPADHGEGYWNYMNRSARPEFARARRDVEEWFGRLCRSMQAGVLQRLQSGDDREFVAGFWELYLHELFARLGYEIICESPVGSGRTIDFLLSRDAYSFYVEATVAMKSDAERGADARRERIYRELDKLSTRNFMLGISIDSAGTADMRNVGTLRSRLESWLASLDPDEAELKWDSEGEGPTFSWRDEAGWSLIFQAIPNKPEFRDMPVERPLGSFIDETGGEIEDERPLRRAMSRKRPSRYGDLSVPYVAAICEDPFSLGDENFHRMNVLFGHSAVEYGDGREPRWVRVADGIWRGPGGRPLNRRLAAVIFASHLRPWTIDRTELEWWDNPFALSPIAEEAVPDVVRRRTLILDEGGSGTMTTIEPLRSPGSVLSSE